MKKAKPKVSDEMLPEYDFRGGVRGKYAASFAKGANVVVLSPDVAKHFTDSRAVNTALRRLLADAKKKHKGA